MYINCTDSNMSIKIVMIDTVTLVGNTEGIEYCQYLKKPMAECIMQPQGATDMIAANQHWQWIENQINDTNANYIIVCIPYFIYLFVYLFFFFCFFFV